MESVTTRTARCGRARYWLALAALAIGVLVAVAVVVVVGDRPAAAAIPDQAPRMAPARLAGEHGTRPAGRGVMTAVPPVAPSAPVPSSSTKASADETEGWRLFSDAKKIITCAAWLKHRPTAPAPADGAATPPDAAGNDTGPYMFSGVDPDRACVNQGAADVAGARDELVRAAMLGNLDARYELLSEQLDTLRASASPSTSPTPAPEQAAQLLGDLRGLALAGNRAAGFLLSDTLANGTLGVRDEKTSIAWTMVAMQGGAGFDRALVASYGGYAGASAADQQALLATATALYDQCCRTHTIAE